MLWFCALGFFPATLLRFEFYFASSVLFLFRDTSLVFFYTSLLSFLHCCTSPVCLYCLKTRFYLLPFLARHFFFSLKKAIFWPTTVFTARHQNTRSIRARHFIQVIITVRHLQYGDVQKEPCTHSVTYHKIHTIKWRTTICMTTKVKKIKCNIDAVWYSNY